MKSTLNNLEGLNRKLNIEVPKEVVASEFNIAYTNIQKEANIQGFRKGKAPISKIKSLYGDRVSQDVVQNLISQGYSAALEEHKLNPISHPKIDFKKLNDDSSFAFTAELEIRPEVTCDSYESLSVEKEILKINASQVDSVIENMQQSRMEEVPVLEDRGAVNGDIVELDFEGFVNGEPLENGAAQGHKLELGSNSFIPGFEEGLVGIKVGDKRDVDVNFPKDYHATDIAGKPVVFKVTVHKLLKKSLPEVNDEFVQTMGAEFKTVQGLRDQIQKDITEDEEKRIKDELKNRLLKKLVEKNPVLVPDSLRAEQKEKLIQDMQQKMTQQGFGGMDFDEYKQKWDKDFNESAEFMIQSSFLIDKLAEDLKLRANGSDIEEKLVTYSKESNIPLDQLTKYYDTEEKKSQLAYQITEDRVVDYLIAKAKIKEVTKDKLEGSPEVKASNK